METIRPRSVTRRQFLGQSAGATAGMASWLALGASPAFAQKRELTLLSWNHFVPAADDELRKQAEAFSKQANCTRARGHHRAPADARQARGGGAVAVGPRHVPHGRRRHVPLREPARERRRRRRQARQAVRRLVPVRRGDEPDQLGLEGRAVVLDLVPRHVQPGALQEGRLRRSAQDLGRAAQAGQGPQEAGQPGGHPHQPLRATRTRPTGRWRGRTGPRCSRPTARHRRSTRTRPRR